MGNCFSCYLKEKRQHDLVKREVEQEVRIAWEKSNYTSEEISQLFQDEYTRQSKYLK